MKKIKIDLLIEYSAGGFLGTIQYLDHADSLLDTNVEQLIERAKYMVKTRLNVTSIQLITRYSLASLFLAFDFINVTRFAAYININPAQLRHYATGAKYPTQKQLHKILAGFYVLGNKMQQVAAAAKN